jgi:hypothetical protein
MRPSHPSGKPIRAGQPVRMPIWRVPLDGYVTPRLRQEAKTEAVGFVHKFECDDE